MFAPLNASRAGAAHRALPQSILPGKNSLLHQTPRPILPRGVPRTLIHSRAHEKVDPARILNEMADADRLEPTACVRWHTRC